MTKTTSILAALCLTAGAFLWAGCSKPENPAAPEDGTHALSTAETPIVPAAAPTPEAPPVQAPVVTAPEQPVLAEAPKTAADGEMVNITSIDEFKEKVVNSEVPVVVDFYTTWCRWCVKLKPILKSLKADYGGKIDFVEIDAEGNAETRTLAQQLGVRSFPSMVVFSGGKPVKGLAGFMEKDALKKHLDTLLTK